MKKSVFLICIVYGIISAYFASLFYIETLAHTCPRSPRQDLSEVAGKTAAQLTDEDYRFIYSQTGLGRPAVNAMEREIMRKMAGML